MSEADEETAFDDVAMSLLLFFLVMTMVSSTAGIYLLKQETTVPPQSSKKAKKIFGEFDLSVHVDAGTNISVRAIGGIRKYAPGSPGNFVIRAETEAAVEVSSAGAEAEEGAMVPYTTSSNASVDLKEQLAAYVGPLRETMAKAQKAAKVYLTADPNAPLAVVHAIRYGMHMVNKELGPNLAMKLVPCPPLSRPRTVEQVVEFNQCMEKKKSQAKCEKRVKMKKAKLKKRFCSLSRLMRS